jgi:hypothetical protein
MASLHHEGYFRRSEQYQIAALAICLNWVNRLVFGH